MAEARAFAEAGFADITWAVPVPPERLAEVAELAVGMDRLNILLDHPLTLDHVEACAEGMGTRFSAFVKVDCGAGRAGVDPAGEAGVSLARRMFESPHVDFRGLLTHAGQAYACRNRAELRTVAVQERDAVVELASRLRGLGVAVPEVSVGSTPTFLVAEDLSGVTETRPGNSAFFDAFQIAIGTCSIDDVAFSVLATVIGSYPERGELLINAGALALSRDPGPVHVDPDCGFGILLSVDGRALDALRLVSLTQEHGLVRASTRLAVERLPIGTRLRVIPNHSCLAAACFDRYHVIDNGRLVDEWRPVRGW
jgi:D-serine deaminase-like pyridoxal phosphate-dependent protein